MPNTKPQKQNDRSNNNRALKIYLWSLLALIGMLFVGIGLMVVTLGSMAGWIVLVYGAPLILLLAALAASNVIFLMYQLIKHRPSGVLWIVSVVTTVASIAFLVWASMDTVERLNEQKAYEQQSQDVINY